MDLKGGKGSGKGSGGVAKRGGELITKDQIFKKRNKDEQARDRANKGKARNAAKRANKGGKKGK